MLTNEEFKVLYRINTFFLHHQFFCNIIFELIEKALFMEVEDK